VTRVAPEVWEHLSGARPKGDNLTARIAAPEITDRLLAAIDADGVRHLLVPMRPEERDLQDTRSRGLSVLTRELGVLGKAPARHLDIECKDAPGHPAFDLIGGEIAEQLVLAREQPAEIVSRVLSKWRRFWGQLPQAMLSREELLGLFAEILFLSAWLIPAAGSEAVSRWRGPTGTRHDFAWRGRSVEVKATTSTKGRVHRIHGLDQLLPPENGELLLFSLRLREEAGASNTLPALVTQCRLQIEADEDALTWFETMLARAGYMVMHEAEYSKLRLRIVEDALFAVRDNFPRITAGIFAEGVPAGVERVEYEINLNTFDNLRIARTPAEATDLLR